MLVFKVLKLRLTLSSLFGSMVKNERVSFTAPPKTLLQSFANPWVLETKTFPIFDSETECLRKTEKGRAIIRLKMKEEIRSPEKIPGTIPENLLIIKNSFFLGIFFSNRGILKTRLFNKVLKTTSKKAAATKNPIAFAKPWDIKKYL